MATGLTKDQFIEILLDKEITRPSDISLFEALYSFEEHKAYASQIGRLLGNTGNTPGSPLNLQIGRLAKRIAKKYDINFTVRENLKYKFWDIFFDGWNEGNYFVWKLKESLVQALEESGLTGVQQYSEEIPIHI